MSDNKKKPRRPFQLRARLQDFAKPEVKAAIEVIKEAAMREPTVDEKLKLFLERGGRPAPLGGLAVHFLKEYLPKEHVDANVVRRALKDGSEYQQNHPEVPCVVALSHGVARQIRYVWAVYGTPQRETKPNPQIEQALSSEDSGESESS